MIFRPSRARVGPDPLLGLKMALFVAGAAIAFTGIALERNALVNVGIVVLVAGLLLRLLRRRDAASRDDGAGMGDDADVGGGEGEGTG